MKTRFILSIKPILLDRHLRSLVLVMFVLAIIFVVMVLAAIQPTELQVAIRYSAFGDTQYYRAQWYWLLGLMLFATMIPAMHIAIISRLLRDDLRALAIGFGYLTIGIITLAIIYTQAIMAVAFLH